jgi:hypothetical protein
MINRALFEYVRGETAPEDMTDGEIRRELAEATGGRRDALRAEVLDRKSARTPDQHYPVRAL